MVRGQDFRAIDVAKVVRARLDSVSTWRSKPPTPPWLRAVERIPPSEILTRPVPIQHRAPNPRLKKPKKLFKPQRIVYEEDELRRTFYKDHPWELARPRVILEIDGKDARYCDWSKGLLQHGIPLSGESVVQRQLWLMHNPHQIQVRAEDPENPSGMKKVFITKGPLSKTEAYDMARREFYQLRQEEEVERRIAREEAMMVGAYFGKNAIQVGNQLEDLEFERWKKWAAQENAAIEAQRTNAYTSFGSKSKADGEVDNGDIEEAIGA